MTGLLKWIFVFTVGSIQAQDPRRRVSNPPFSPIEEMRLMDKGIIVACSEHHCLVKRSSAGQDEMGPFWANRGKKDPSYQQEALYAEEPYWVLVRRDSFQEEPFFISRGKKEAGPSLTLRLRDRRELPPDVDSPFFAARGKRAEANN